MAQDIEYVSEFTRFMNEFLDKNPQLKEQQIRHRATWWDREIDRELQAGFAQARIKKKPYVYQPD